jgi:hypothetical protein
MERIAIDGLVESPIKNNIYKEITFDLVTEDIRQTVLVTGFLADHMDIKPNRRIRVYGEMKNDIFHCREFVIFAHKFQSTLKHK